MGPEIYIKGSYIEIGKLIKKLGLVNTGGQVKYFMETNKILINNIEPKGRNTKVYVNNTIWINSDVYILKNENEEA